MRIGKGYVDVTIKRWAMALILLECIYEFKNDILERFIKKYGMKVGKPYFVENK
jgi:hypothetical protein